MEKEKYGISENDKPRFDAVVALGKNWRRNLSGVTRQEFTHLVRDESGKPLIDWENNPLTNKSYRIYLSLESKMTALAAGQMYVEGKAGKIIFSTGETAGKDPEGNPYPTEAEEMKRFMRIFFPKDVIPESAIELESQSFDTAGNAEEVKKCFKKKEFRVSLC